MTCFSLTYLCIVGISILLSAYVGCGYAVRLSEANKQKTTIEMFSPISPPVSISICTLALAVEC